MHPARSVIFFTTTTGAGYGLVVWLVIAAALGLVPPQRTFGFLAMFIAAALIVAGLVSSTMHLGHPERAWRAMSQWRSSWLSREGLAAIIAFLPIGVFGAAWAFAGKYDGWVLFIGVLAAAASMAVVYTTSMIYASLKAIPNWSNTWTRPAYLVLSLATGAVLLTLLAALWGFSAVSWTGLAAALLLAGGLAVKLAYWHSIDTGGAVSTAESATGLGHLGRVKLVESPHTEPNYLMQEMGFRIARKHAAKLRNIAIVAGFVAPNVLLLALVVPPFTGYGLSLAGAALAALLTATGIAVERWLFFAEAKHVVTLYYGESKV